MDDNQILRDQFTFYRSYYEALKVLPKRDQVGVMLAICAYALDAEEPALSGVPLSVFTLIRPTLDTGRNKARNRINKQKTNAEQKKNKPEQNGKEKEGEKEKEKEGESEGEKEGERENDSSLPPAPLSGGTALQKTTPRRTRFVPPSLEEVTAYVRERGSPVDPQGFIDFYAAKGWMVGKSPMKDWRAACRNAESWERWNRGTRGGPQSSGNVFMEMLREEERRGQE